MSSRWKRIHVRKKIKGMKKSEITDEVKLPALKKTAVEEPEIPEVKGTRRSFTYSPLRKKSGTMYSPKY